MKFFMMFLLVLLSINSFAIDYKSQTELGLMVTGGNHSSIAFHEKGEYDITIANFNKIGFNNLFIFNKEENQHFLSELSSSINYAPLFSQILYPEIAYEFYKNEYKKINFRHKGIVGITFNSFIELGAYYTYEYEKKFNYNTQINHLIYLNMDIKYMYFDKLMLNLNGKFYKILNYTGWRLKMAPSLSFKVFSKVDFKLSFIYNYESAVVNAIKKYDYRLLHSVVVTL